MKNFKKLSAAFLSLVMLLSLLAGCSNSGTASGNNNGGDASDGTYTITVKTQGGMVMPGLDVYVYADKALTDLKQAGKTDENGSVSFTMPLSSDYAISVTGAPKGYVVEQFYGFTGNSANITLSTKLVEDSISGAKLGVGDVMYDFSVKTPGGQEITLSEVLKEKKAVLLNFWYTSCTWCVTEFPIMQQAYEQYSEDIAILALNPTGESDAAIAAFQAEQGLSFPMASCSISFQSAFGFQGYPTSVLVDRDGVICLIEEGAITSLRPFISMFEHFAAEKYEQKLFTSVAELVVRPKPTQQMDTSENVAALLNSGEITVTYRPEDDEYSFPFVATEREGEKCLMASNQQMDGTYAILYADVELKKGQTVGFDYLVSSESGNDVMHVIVDENPIYSISGVDEEPKWQTCYPWVADKDGTYEVALCYIKDDSNSAGEDTVYIKNVRILDAASIDIPTYLPRFAAMSEDGFSYTYASIVYNEQDGYYHVGSENGPLLLADLMNTTQFNEEATVWSMVDDGLITVDGHDYYEEMVDYCSLASNSALNGVCTVDKELAELLKIVAQVAGFEDNDNEWLKICKYYEAYGSGGKQLQDPIQGLCANSALTAKEGKGVESNSFYYDRALLPRGKLAEFIPSRSGVYRISSTNGGDSAGGVEGWIVNQAMEQVCIYEKAERIYDYGDDISMLYYMEAGVPYYIDICFWDMYETGTITYDIEYLGSTYKSFRFCSPAFFTFDPDATGENAYYLITEGVKPVLGTDGKYYEDLGKDANGKQKYGSLIYVDFTGITGLFGTPVSTVPAYNEDGTVAKDDKGNPKMVTGMIDLGGFDFSRTENDDYIISFLRKNDWDVEKTDAELRELWGDQYDAYDEIYQLEDVYEGRYHGEGENRTEDIKKYLDDIITSGPEELQGCVVVTEELAEILQLLVDKFTFTNNSGSVENSWLKMCYYYDYLGPEG